MAEKTKRNRSVDDAGIRLAPSPVNAERSVAMPSLSQQFVITPELHIDAPADDPQKTVASTAKDFQPKKQDVSKKWKRQHRNKNIVVGLIMLLLSAAILLQYIFGAIDGMASKLNTSHFVLVPVELGALNNLVNTVRVSIEAGWTSQIAKTAWINCVPSLILTVGILAIFVNFIKAITGICGAIKPRKYILSALIYLLMAAAVLIVYLVGAPAIGVEKVDFMADIIKGYKSSEIFSIVVIALGYFVVSVVCSWIASEKYGCLK